MTDLVRPAVFGAFDGVVTVLGVLFALSGHPHALTQTACGLAVAGAVSMAGGQYLSDSEHGLGASAVIGATTGAGTVLPALPYLVWHGSTAAVVAALVCLAVAGLICRIKVGPRLSLWRSVSSTYGLLLLAAGATLLCSWLTGAVG